MPMLQALATSAPFAVLLCAALYLFTLTLRFDFPRAPGRLGPDIWPQAILVLLMLACAAGIVRTLRWPERPVRAVAPADAGAPRCRVTCGSTNRRRRPDTGW